MIRFLFFIFVISTILFSCKKPGVIEEYNEQDWMAGGTQTVFEQGSGAYRQTFPTLSGELLATHGTGDAMFEATFVSAPAPKNSGLGPIYNAVSCATCHINDGRGMAPIDGGSSASLFLKLSSSGQDIHGAPNELPGFGVQLQTKAIFGTQAEGDLIVTYEYETGYFEDGTSYELRRPTFTINNPYTSMGSYLFSPRFSRPVFGLGLLEAIPEWAIIANEDNLDVNQDGISGKANYVWDIKNQKTSLGRFGWKAGVPSILQQVAAAYSQDIGMTNFLFPKETSFTQSQYDNLSDENELSDSLLYATAMYIRTLAVPARRNVQDPEVIKGKQLFNSASCIKCHTPKHTTGVNVAFADLSNQTIFPYTDMLLHDMGPNLTDNRPEYLAFESEWRTPPLWGIGLSVAVNNHSFFLHDGRARNLSEAILWHGGEAILARENYRKMSASDRAALLKFLNSL
ncbi:MAG: c-type cytochrome [Flavobacteriia bacterium]|nr:c-type cytochrome [Flavobacteriia bacterium]